MRRFAGWLVFLAPFAACGDEVEDAGDVALTPAQEEQRERLAEIVAEALCDKRMSCDCLTLVGPVGEDPEAYTVARCRANRAIEIDYWQNQLEHFGLRFDPACFAQRLEFLQAPGCPDGRRVAMAAECAAFCRVYHGDLQEGARCSVEDVDRCGQGLRCAYVYDPQTGYPEQDEPRCVATCPGVGEPCPDYRCALDAYCDYNDLTCRAVIPPGGACPSYDGCDLGSQCLGAEATCVALLEDGEACDVGVGGCLGTCSEGTCVSNTPAVCGWDLRF